VPLLGTRGGGAIVGFGRFALASGVEDTGAMFPLGMVQVGSGGSSEIEFASIPSTYTHLQIRCMTLQSNTNADIEMRFNSDTISNYSIHYLYGEGSSPYSGNSINTDKIYVSFNSGHTTYPVDSIVDILDYKNTDKYKTTRTLSGFDRNGVGGYAILTSGNWRSSSAITSIKIYNSAGNFNQYSSFALYGIKGA